ncbi:MAG: hypothetical protein R3288_08625 [Woeseiaceae bacterium]|nr:hypothetical protein [Woeseiaceae bacterium]
MRRESLLTVSVALLLAACGGSGGDNAVVSPDPTLAIDSSNAVPVSKAAYGSARSADGLGGMTGSGPFTGSAPGGVSKADLAIAAATKNGGGEANVPIPPETTPCGVDGTQTISGQIADPITPTLTAGDFFEIAYNACDDGLGDVIDGVMRMDIVSFSGDLLTQMFDMTVKLTLNTYQVTTGQDVLTSHGDATVTVNTLTTPAMSTSLRGNSMRTDSNSNTETLTNFTAASTVNLGLVPSPYTMSSSGTLDSSELDGIIRYSTPVEFAGFDSNYPDSGELLVVGAESSLRLIAVDNVNVTIELDTDGDGTVDETIQTTWQEIAG